MHPWFIHLVMRDEYNEQATSGISAPSFYINRIFYINVIIIVF